MKFRFSYRKWHAWISFVLSLPILLVSVTAILISHGQALGLRDVKLYPAWLPGYTAAQEQRREELQRSNAGGPREMTLAKLIRDLHTGDAFFGHDYRWIWNDIVGGAMTFLALTGIYLWWHGQRKMVFSKRLRR